MTIVTGKPSIVILSRGERLGPLYRGVARTLAADYRILAVMGWPDEAQHWQHEQATLIDLPAAQAALAVIGEAELRSRAQAIEDETGLPVYKAASNYLLYRRFNKAYFGTWPDFYNSERHMLEEYVASYDVLKPLLELERPAMVLHEALDLISTLMAQALCWRLGIFNLGFVFGPGVGDGKIVFYYGLRRQLPVFTHYLRHPEQIEPAILADARALIARNASSPLPVQTHIAAERDRGHRPLSQRLLRGIRAAANPRTWRSLGSNFKAMQNIRALDRMCRRDLPAEPYVLFMMHRQPEASTASQLPRWVDQDVVVEQMAINAPIGWKIVVKEHPRNYGSRGSDYYARLLDLPNVHLVHPSLESDRLIRGCAAMVTLTGSAGLEAILLGKPVACLGRPFYSEFPCVKLISYPDEIWRHMRDKSWLDGAATAERETWLAAYLHALVELGPVDFGKIWPAFEIAGPNLAQGLRRTLALIGGQGLSPRDFDPGWDFESGSVANGGALAGRSDEAMNALPGRPREHVG